MIEPVASVPAEHQFGQQRPGAAPVRRRFLPEPAHRQAADAAQLALQQAGGAVEPFGRRVRCFEREVDLRADLGHAISQLSGAVITTGIPNDDDR
ncbi:hypothetical protein GCM10020366_69970 [Saccharopolyspora gregorii]|uniref:Uncharacterized protein n=1 Tax=Saccharopolyspora gregorii TaxID=33914 RepID=A0ABP6S2U5_9PSEU